MRPLSLIRTVGTSKRLTYLLRHNKETSLGRRNDALFENIDRQLQALGFPSWEYQAEVYGPCAASSFGLRRFAEHRLVHQPVGRARTLASVRRCRSFSDLGSLPSPWIHLSCHSQQELGRHQRSRARSGSHQGGRPVPAPGHPYGLCWGLGGAEAWDAHTVRQVHLLLQCEV